MVNYWEKQPNWKVFWYTLQPTKRMRLKDRIRRRMRETRLAYEWRETIKPKLIAFFIVPNAEGYMTGYHSDVKVDCWIL